ncbi:MAG: DUF262 domain-containing protein [Geobacteraceae bacterium]|nr:DUF262 domain-containing protein [Geobacteraceae bacterium]
MSQVQEIKIQLEGVSNVLKTKRFRVPPYQRSYAWEREHVEALLNDINEAIHSKENEYFLGSIVVTGPVNQRYEVVDGQQRLTTVSILVAAIKDIFQRDGDFDVVNSVKTDFLASIDRKSKEKEPRLVLNEVDNELYQELIESIPNVNKERFSRQSHKRLLDAADTIFKYMEDVCTKSKDSEDELHAWLDYLEINLKVIVVTAPDDSNAFIIFETLNDRGLELAISDLLKNYLFHKSGEKIEETKNRWLSMSSVLEGASDDPLVVTFLRHFVMSRYGLVREKDLFGLIKKKVTSKKLALQFSTDLSNSARTYSALINSDHDFWNKYDGEVRKAVEAFNILGMAQLRPLLLAILEKFDPPKVSKSFKKLVSVAVRFQIVGGVGGGTLERIYSDTAKAVTELRILSVAEILNAFTTLPTDSTFKQAFASTSISKQALARFYLRCLEEEAGSGEKEWIPNKDTGRVNLEHVLPITLSPAWLKTWNLDEAKAYQRRLGNLSLMASRMNVSAGNDDFASKKALYCKSKFLLTKQLDEFNVWDKDAIEKRQEKMADLALKAWSIKA